MYRTLPSSRRNVRLSTKYALKAVRQLSNTRIRHADTPPSPSPSPAPKPPKTRRFFRRLFIYTASVIAGFYASSPLVAFNNERFYDFFFESAPFGSAIIDYAESQNWDRTLTFSILQPKKKEEVKKDDTALAKNFNNVATKGGEQAKNKEAATQNEAKGSKAVKDKSKEVAEKASSSQVAVRNKTQDFKEKAQKAAADAEATVMKRASSTKAKAKEVEEIAKDSTKNTSAEVKSSIPVAVQQLPNQFSEELAKLVQEVEAALSGSVDVRSQASTSTSTVSEPHETTKVSSKDEKKENDGKVYTALPVGFEPPPGYVKAKASSASVPIGLLRYPPSLDPNAEKLPQLTPSIEKLSAAEPIVSHIAGTIDELASLLNSSPHGSVQAREILDNAKADLVKLLERIDGAREEEHTKLEAQLDEQAREYSLKLLETDLAAQDKLDQQENEFKEFFEEERQKFLKHYREKLDNELNVQRELIDERLRQELLAQGVELQRQWIRDLKIHVEQERGGRLAKLDEIAANMKRLERITLDNTEYLDENVRVHRLWSALRALETAINSPERRPFRDELRALRHMPAAQNDPLISTALQSIEATDIPDIGIEPFPDLATWFSTSVSPQVSRVALVPEQDAGILSYLVSHLISYIQFRRHGLVDGNDVLSVLARTEYRLNEKDLDGATRELNQLQGASRLLLQDWLEAARRRLEVLQAIEVIQTQATLSSLLIV